MEVGWRGNKTWRVMGCTHTHTHVVFVLGLEVTRAWSEKNNNNTTHQKTKQARPSPAFPLNPIVQYSSEREGVHVCHDDMFETVDTRRADRHALASRRRIESTHSALRHLARGIDEQLCNLYRIQRCALAYLVATDEEIEALVALLRHVMS